MAEKTTKELLTCLDEHITYLGAIADAAKDFVTAKEKLLPMNKKGEQRVLMQTQLAYENLCQLILPTN